MKQKYCLDERKIIKKTDTIAILIAIIFFGLSIVPIIKKGQFNFETDYMTIAFGASSSIVIALLIIILSQLIELKNDFEENREFPRDKELSDLINPFISSFLKIKDSNDKLFENRLDELANIFKIYFSDLKNGHIVLEETERWEEFTLNMIRSLKADDECKATSLVYTPGWWESEFGEKYFEENKKAIERGAKITRIFLLDEVKKYEHYAKEIKRQSEIGVEVRIICNMDGLFANQIENFLVVGSKYSSSLELTNKGIVRRMHIYNTNIEIDRKNALFSDLEIRSKSLDECKDIIDL